jgi:hypothetical protein
MPYRSAFGPNPAMKWAMAETNDAIEKLRAALPDLRV